MTDDKKGPVSDFLDRAREVVDDVVDGVKQQRKSNPVVITGEESIRGAARAGRRIAGSLVETAVGVADKVVEGVGEVFSGDEVSEEPQNGPRWPWPGINFRQAEELVEEAKKETMQALANIGLFGESVESEGSRDLCAELGRVVLRNYIFSETPAEQLLAVIKLTVVIDKFSNTVNVSVVHPAELADRRALALKKIWLPVISRLGGLFPTQIEWGEQTLSEIRGNCLNS